LILADNFWKWIVVVLKVVNFVKDFQNDSYNKAILMVKKWNEKNLLTTIKKWSQFFKCVIKKLDAKKIRW